MYEYDKDIVQHRSGIQRCHLDIAQKRVGTIGSSKQSIDHVPLGEVREGHVEPDPQRA